MVKKAKKQKLKKNRIKKPKKEKTLVKQIKKMENQGQKEDQKKSLKVKKEQILDILFELPTVT